MEFQRHLLDLHARGVILAIASKNNAADVDEIFATNKAMVLAQSHFAALEVHWRSKTESLANIAARLNIGLEHIVFVDDNPAECEEVRRSLPAVTVICLPTQPERFVETLSREGLFDTLSLSAEDRRRGELYRQRAQAEELRTSAGSLDDYYRDLEMQLTIASVDRDSLVRAAQLTQKTNQFNVTTRRSTEAEIARRASDPGWVVATIGVRDRFGDNGIVGFVMARHAGDTLDIDTLLLSCRVIGRTVETAMLAHLCDRARELGATALTGTIIPTPKNEPVHDLFARHAFAKRRRGRCGGSISGMAGSRGLNGSSDPSSPPLPSRATDVRFFPSDGRQSRRANPRNPCGHPRHGCTQIDERAAFDRTPGWDSANHINLVVALEEEFSITLDVAEIDTMLTFDDVVRTVEAKL